MALEVFVEQGYQATSVSDLTTRLGVSHGTFYRYFDGKRDILDEVVDAGVEQFMAATGLDEIPGDIVSVDDLLAQVRALAERVLELVEAEPELARLIVLEATSVDEEMTLRLMGLMDLFAGLAAPYFERAAAAGVLRPGVEADVVGDALVGMLLPGLVLAFRGELDDAARDRQIEALVALIRDGMVAPEN